jgi:hypothetical protein
MKKKSTSNLEIVLSLFAITICVSLFLKAIIDVDENYDVGWYHLPFAARIWEIIPEPSFTSGAKIEYRYDGFPLLAHFFQGLLWKATGRFQATNLVGYISLFIYFFYLRNYFKVPLYLSIIALFSIPAVLTHSTTSFVDLPGNIGVSVLIMMIFSLFRQSRLPKKGEILAAFLGATIAANIKPQLQPLVFILYVVLGVRLIWLYFQYGKAIKRYLKLTISLAIIASSLIFATPIKNIISYGNPFYPTKVEIAGIVLNHQLTPDTYNEGNRPKKWLSSVLEVNSPPWSPDQWNRNDYKYQDRTGGFFGAYVVFNLSLLIGLTFREQLQNITLSAARSYDATTALIIVLLMSIVPANFPQSHELRYFMFWMIVLVSVNLYLIFSSQRQSYTVKLIKWFQPKYFGWSYLLFFVIVCIKIESRYLMPEGRILPVYLDTVINEAILQEISAKEVNCIVSSYNSVVPIQHVFYYSSYFHPEKSNYSIKVAPNIESCADHKIINPSS